MLLQVAVDGGLEVGDRAEDAATDALAGQLGEEVFHGIEPGSGGRGEVEHPARVAVEPGFHFGVLVSGIIVEAGKLVHAILDDYATHKHPKVKAWLSRHPRWVFHFTPTSGSWLNAVENFFSTMTRQRIRHGVFHSIGDLQAAINRFLKQHNDDPKPFIWTKPVNVILPNSAGCLYLPFKSVH